MGSSHGEGLLQAFEGIWRVWVLVIESTGGARVDNRPGSLGVLTELFWRCGRVTETTRQKIQLLFR